MPSRIVLPPPKTASSPGHRQVALDLADQVGVGQPEPVAGRRVRRARRSAAARSASGLSQPSSRSTANPRARSGRGERLAAAPADRARRPRGRARRSRPAARRTARGRPRACRPARTGPPFRPGYRAAARRPRAGRTGAPDSPRRSGSASRPGSAGRRCSRPTIRGHGSTGVQLDVAVGMEIAADRTRPAHGIGSWQETSFVPSGRSPRHGPRSSSSGTSSITSSRVRTCRPARAPRRPGARRGRPRASLR